MSLVWLDSSGGVTEVLISCSVNLLSPPVPPRWSSALHGRFSSPMNIIKAYLLPQKKNQNHSTSICIMYHHVSSCVAYLLTLDGLESCLFWPNDEIQTSSARQTPPILSFSGYLTDDELGALDAADPRKALSEFGASWSFLNTICPFRK